MLRAVLSFEGYDCRTAAGRPEARGRLKPESGLSLVAGAG